MTFTQKYSRKQIRRERPILTNSCPYGIVESETKYLLISSVVCFACCWRRLHGAPFVCVACNEWKALPHNSAARLAMFFPPSAACKFLDLHPVNLRNLHLHLTKNPFASRLPHCAVLPKSTLDKSHSKRGFVKPSPWQGRTYSPPASRRWYPSRWSGSCTLRWGVSLSAESDRKFGKPHSLHEKRRCWQKYSSGIFRDDAALPIALGRILYAVFYRLPAP